MKREVFCVSCGNRVRKLFKSDTPYDGEWVKFVGGRLVRCCFCDSCNAQLNHGDQAVAFSCGTDSNAIYEWENEYFDTSTMTEITENS